MALSRRFVIGLFFLVPVGGFSPSFLRAAEAPPQRELVVFAAASLVNAFTEIKKDFEASHPGVKVTYNFAGSQQLRAQIEQGATPGVFASANIDEIDALAAKKFLDKKDTHLFAYNKLVVLVNARSGKKIAALKDLATPGIKVVLADASVPVGKYSVKFLDAASRDSSLGADYKTAVLKNVVSYETNVRAVAAKVSLGEADAGIVYTTDEKSAQPGSTLAIEIPGTLNQIAKYPVAALAKAPDKELAQAFVDALLSPAGKKTLDHYGFITE